MTYILPFDPDMGEGIEETRGYETVVYRRRNGSEQRRGLRVVPRMSTSHSFTFIDDWLLNGSGVAVPAPGTGSDWARLQALVYRGQASAWFVPRWQYSKKSGGTITSGTDTTISVDTTNGQYRAGQYVMVWVNEFKYAVMKIASFTSSVITLALSGAVQAGVAAAFAAGATLVPVEIGRMSEKLSIQPLTSIIAVVKISYLMDSMA